MLHFVALTCGLSLLLIALRTVDGRSATAEVSCQAVWLEDSLPSSNVPRALEAVAVLAKDDVWAVGSKGTSLDAKVFVLHWDGSNWSEVEAPNPSGYFNALKDVSASGPADIWAVGWQSESQGAVSKPLPEHWDGLEWSAVDTPDLGKPAGFRGVLALATDDVWAVGGAGGALIEHWDGTSWHVVPAPNVNDPVGIDLTSIDGNSPNSLWAVGPPGVPGLNDDYRTVLHWDGSQWSSVPKPTDNVDLPTFEDVSVSTNGDVWAAGTPRLAEHLVGTQWTNENGGLPEHSGFGGIIARSSTDVWGVGSHYSQSGLEGLVAHWNGTTWVEEPDAPTDAYLFGIDGDWLGDLWAVGTQGNDAFIEHYCTAHSRTMVWADLDCSGGMGSGDVIIALRAVSGLSPGFRSPVCPSFGRPVSVAGMSLSWGDLDCDGNIRPPDALVAMLALGNVQTSTAHGCPSPGAQVEVS